MPLRTLLSSDTPRYGASGVDAFGVVIDGQGDIQQRVQRLRQMSINDLVAGLSPLRFGNNNSAVPQAGEMVRHVRARQFQILGESGRVGRPPQQRQENAGTSRIRHGPTQPVHHV
ncbi:hypothetical protein CDES_14535 (plasmid) [Corynebacterium deserti GIMN1.010]|uniref:Uncharacterized protein n=1 Tax=Corynebacterium deserti GIMN1.010 TaxID=931089 RepID=A0A0M4D0M3_9CORY|nr:hypothetical protein CDES_14535 [Corynebacterium deserti GIMN1.010]